jgi:hypothetical protein
MFIDEEPESRVLKLVSGVTPPTVPFRAISVEKNRVTSDEPSNVESNVRLVPVKLFAPR